MRKVISVLISVIISSSVLFAVPLTAHAAEDELTINKEAKVKTGDIVTFRLNLADLKEQIIGFDMSLVYDTEYLELVEDGVDLPKFDGYFYNSNYGDIIPIVWTSINNPSDFSKKDEFLSAKFKVLKGGETEISKWITDMYGSDMTYIKSYTWTYDILLGDEKLVSDKIPPVADNTKLEDLKEGSYTNYLDGMGEENSPNAGDKHEAASGLRVSENYTEIVEVTKYVKAGNGSSMNTTGILIITALFLFGVLIVSGVVIVKRKDKNSGDNENETENFEVLDEESV